MPDPSDHEWFWTELALIRERWGVLDHPYVKRFAGGLGRDGVLLHVSDYDHVMVALAEAAAAARLADGGLMAELLDRWADHREARLAAWRLLAGSVGWAGPGSWSHGQDPCPATVACAASWGDAGVGLAGQLVTFHIVACVEAELRRAVWPALCAATVEADLLSVADLDQPELWAAALQGRLTDADPFAVLRRAQEVGRVLTSMFDELDDHCRRTDAATCPSTRRAPR